MKPVCYLVKAGDTLWSIAESHYDDPVRWPDLYAYNNRPDILALTERPIVNPDRMIPGQVIFLPPGKPRASQRRAPAGGATNPLRSVGSAGLPTPARNPLGRGGSGQGAWSGATLVASSLDRNPAAETFVNDFAHAFQLDGAEMAVRGPAFAATLTLHGTVSLQRIGRVPLVSYSSRSAEIGARSHSAMLLGQLLSTQGTRLGWNPPGNGVAYAAALIASAGITSPTATLSPGATRRGEPVLKAELALPDFSGRIAGHVYLVRGLTIDIALKADRSREAPPTAGSLSANDRTAWLWADGARSSQVLILGAVVAADAVTAGGGLADASTTLAAAPDGGSSAVFRSTTASPTPVRIGGS